MPLADELEAFFRAEDFAREFTHEKSGAVFRGIFDAPDVLSMQALAITADYTLLYPSAAANLRENDLLIDGGGQGFAPGTLWQVRSNPVRTNDGRTSSVDLSRRYD